MSAPPPPSSFTKQSVNVEKADLPSARVRRCRIFKFRLNTSSSDVSDKEMKVSKVIVPWREGLHLRHAVKLVQLGKLFKSTISLKCGSKIADIRSIMSIITLCATMGTALDVEVKGDDEAEATRAVEQAFSSSSQTVAATDAVKQG